MKTKLIPIILILTIVCVLAAVFVLAKPDMPDKAKNPVVIPAHAVEVAPGVFYLGKALDKGRVVEGYAMFVKPTCDNDGICDPEENPSCADCKKDVEDPEEPDTSSCYEFLAREAKWKSVEDYIVNPTTTWLDRSFVTSNLASNIDKWETAADYDVLGSGSSTNDILVADTVSPDDKNEVYFADIDYEGAIAIAIIWGYFSGPPFARELVEWDMVFDDVDFDWSKEGEEDKMDFENIATHELGHAVGLGDLYNDACSEQTMYGYSTEGETKKQTLESGDIAGIQKLYY